MSGSRSRPLLLPAYKLRYLRTMEENSVATGANVKCLPGWKFVPSGPLSRIMKMWWVIFPNFPANHHCLYSSTLIDLENHSFTGALLHNTQGYHFALSFLVAHGVSHPNIRGSRSENRFVQNHHHLPWLTKYPVFYHFYILRRYGLTISFRDLLEWCNG